MTVTNGQRLSNPIVSKSQTGNIIVQVTNNDNLQSKLTDKSKYFCFYFFNIFYRLNPMFNP